MEKNCQFWGSIDLHPYPRKKNLAAKRRKDGPDGRARYRETWSSLVIGECGSVAEGSSACLGDGEKDRWQPVDVEVSRRGVDARHTISILRFHLPSRSSTLIQLSHTRLETSWNWNFLKFLHDLSFFHANRNERVKSSSYSRKERGGKRFPRSKCEIKNENDRSNLEFGPFLLLLFPPVIDSETKAEEKHFFFGEALENIGESSFPFRSDEAVSWLLVRPCGGTEPTARPIIPC